MPLPPPPPMEPIEDIEGRTGEYHYSQAPIMPVHPKAREMNRLPSGLPAPPTPPPPPSDISDKGKSFLQKALPYLPTLLGMGAGIYGLAKGDMGWLAGGAGAAQGGSGELLRLATEKRKQDAEKEENRMRNTGARIDKMRRLAGSDARYAEIVSAYDRSLEDGSFSAKEASKLQELMDGLPDVEGTLQQQELDRELGKAQKLAEFNDKLKKAQYVDTPFGKMDADEWARIQATMSGQESADKRAAERLAAMQAFELGRERRHNEREDRLARQFGQGQDFKFMGQLDDFTKAEGSIDEIEGALGRFKQASWFTSPMEKGLAANELRSKVSGLSTSIGRTLGERGVFTDADRATFKQILNPGLVLTDLAPEEADKRLNDLRNFVNYVKEKKIKSYQMVNPGTVFGGGGGPSLPPPPNPDNPPGLPPPPSDPSTDPLSLGPF